MQFVYIPRPLPSFEWDEGKRERNLEKHGVDFVDAAEAFARPIGLVDSQGDRGEKRFLAIGEVGERVVAVVFTWREGRVRIISARRASRRERRAYRHLRSPEA